MDKSAIFDVIINNIEEILPQIPREQIRLDGSLVELGANSIDRMEVVTFSMEDLGIKVPLQSLAKIDNLAGLVDLFHKHLHESA
ncbi:acyl carrier protein (plasmid) [Photobacterium sp. GJ3]|uniref:acyl carrier protein n=1 Tax=Photobacterium sp. GJ3 TaxID=2829502 RepID=UPI001B8D9F08|nr:acyl carrier protein [Photobacterium sp. GJ3]QUJ69458.1 acyl carrier protein [Photobacterium sp. GJ3]